MRRQKLTHQPAVRQADQFSEAELLAKEFTSADPESLQHLSDDPPPDEEWEVEYTYDMKDREVKVRCVFCKYLNHYSGVVVKYYPSGTRRLVGHKCAFIRYGIEFENELLEFNAAAERQSYVRQRREVFANVAKVSEEFQGLRNHPAVRIHDSLRRTWRDSFPDLFRAVGDVVKRGEALIVDRLVHDEAAERARKERLGDSFEAERRRAKEQGQRWQLTKTVQHLIGPVAGPLFFLPGISVAQRLDEIQTEAQRQFLVLASENLRTAQIKSALHELALVVDQIRHEFDRLDALQQAFHPDNLKRIASWANDIIEEEGRGAALLENRRRTSAFGRYVAEGSSIADNWRSGVTVALPAHRVPKRTLVDRLTKAISLKAEPRPDANANANDPQ